MAKIVIEAEEGSKITNVSSDNGDVDLAIVAVGEADPIAMKIGCNPDLVSEYEAKVCFTSDDLPADGDIEEEE